MNGNKELTEIICDYNTDVEFGKKKLIIECNECENGGKELNHQICRASVVNILVEEYNINEIVLSGPIEKQYSGDSVELFNRLSSLTREIRNFARISPMKIAKENNIQINSKKMKKVCDNCNKSPVVLFNLLENELKTNYAKFVNTLRKEKNYHNHNPNNPLCQFCRKKVTQNCDYLFEKSVDLSDFILYSAYKLVVKESGKGRL